MQVTIENGNKEVTISITGSREWEGGDKERVYYDMSFSAKRTPVTKFYQIISGETRDHVFEIGGKKFGFEFGVDANSNSKKASVQAGLQELAKQLAA